MEQGAISEWITACDGSLHQTSISILLGNGDGTFGAANQFPSGTTPVSIAAGDFNEDGKVDLAALDNYPNPTVSILLGNNDGTFQSPVAYSVFSSPFWTSWISENGSPSAPFPSYVVAADFNKDGHLDLLVGDGDTYNDGDPVNGHSYNNGVQLFLGNGDGTFQPEQSYLAGRQGTFLAVADINGDGNPDVAVVDSEDRAVTILLNQSFSPPVANLSPTSPSFGSQRVGTTSAAQKHYADQRRRRQFEYFEYFYHRHECWRFRSDEHLPNGSRRKRELHDTRDLRAKHNRCTIGSGLSCQQRGG